MSTGPLSHVAIYKPTFRATCLRRYAVETITDVRIGRRARKDPWQKRSVLTDERVEESMWGMGRKEC